MSRITSVAFDTMAALATTSPASEFNFETNRLRLTCVPGSQIAQRRRRLCNALNLQRRVC
jgi:hypothetical protein